MPTKREDILQTVGDEKLKRRGVWELRVEGRAPIRGYRRPMKEMFRAYVFEWMEDGHSVCVKKEDAEFYRAKVDGELSAELYLV